MGTIQQQSSFEEVEKKVIFFLLKNSDRTDTEYKLLLD